jgi:hypothetical protein
MELGSETRATIGHHDFFRLARARPLIFLRPPLGFGLKAATMMRDRHSPGIPQHAHDDRGAHIVALIASSWTRHGFP